MPAAATSHQLLLNLNASGAPASSKGRADKSGGNDFAATFQQQVQQQISARQSERLNQTDIQRQNEIQRPRNEAPQRERERERDIQATRPDRQDNTTRPANETRPQNTERAANEAGDETDIDQNAGCEKPQQTGEGEATRQGGKTAQTGKPAKNEAGEGERSTSAEEALAQQLNQANAALLLQLQNFVAVRPDVAAAAATNGATDQGDAAASPVAQLANVLNALQQIHDQSQDAALDANAGKALVKGDAPQFKTDSLTEALQFAADRQALPADAEADAKVTLEFSELLQRRLPQTEQPIGPRNDMGLQGVNGRPAESPRAADATRPQASLYQPVGSEGWDRALGHKVVMMVDNSQQEVDMQLNPPNLGPLEVKLTLDKNEATLTFVAAHQPVKEALQASLPRLTEMLAESGIQLGNVNIELGGRQAEQGREQAPRQGGRSGNGPGGEDDEGVTAVNSQAARRLAMTAPGNVNLFV